MLNRDRQFLDLLVTHRKLSANSVKIIKLLQRLIAISQLTPELFDKSTEEGKERYDLIILAAIECDDLALKIMVKRFEPECQLKHFRKKLDGKSEFYSESISRDQFSNRNTYGEFP